MSDDFDDAAQYSALSQEISKPSADELGEELGLNLPKTPLDEKEVAQYTERQNQAHRQAVQRAPQQPQQEPQQQPPQQEQPQGPPTPTLEDNPVGFFQHKTAQLEQAVAQSQQEQVFWAHVDRSEAEAKAQLGQDYEDGIRFLEQQRWDQLCQMHPDEQLKAQGYANPFATRLAMLNQDRLAVATIAVQRGISPAALYFQLAQNAGYRPTGASKGDRQTLNNLYDAGNFEAYDKAWSHLASRNLL